MAEGLNDKGEWGSIIIRIPPELRGYGPSFARFFDAMVYKMRRNAHKGKWENVPLDRAMGALEKERKELEGALSSESTTEVLMEGADVANQALIVTEIMLEAKDRERV